MRRNSVLCSECNKRDACIELCQLAEEYADKGHIKLKERRALDLGIILDSLAYNEIITVELLNVEDWRYLLKKVPTLTKKQKRYFYLFYWKGMLQKDIGKLCGGVKQATVSDTIVRARNKIMALNFQ